MASATYPFTAVVGMDDMRLGLLLNAISPSIGGVLVRGEKGTAKSTMVRGIAALMPAVDVVTGCRFSCDPALPDPACPDGPHADGDRAAGGARAARMVELPVGASEDRLVGALDIERALSEGVKAFEPGLLADAHRGVLYVDEVNLLHDHLVDLLLDAAAMGSSYVEREGVSVRHAARFLLVGTMNPEEGELRPQLLDRFGLTVEVAASRETDERVEVVRRRLAYDEDPAAFAAKWAAEEDALRERIAAARALLPGVRLGDGALRRIAAVCAGFEVDGMRADIVTARTATALAAWAGRTDVTAEDVRQAALLALPHRRRRNPFDAPGLDEDRLDEILRQFEEDEPEPEPEDPDGGPDDGPDGGPGGGESPEDGQQGTPDVPEQREEPTRDDSPHEPSAAPRALRPPSRTRQPDRATRTTGPVRPRAARVPSWAPPSRSGRASSTCPGSARAPTGAAPARAPRTAGPPGRAAPGAPCPSCTWRRPCRPRPRTSGRAAVRGRAWWCAGTICGRRCARAARAISCCSSWTPPVRWRPASGWVRSRVRCCRCCSTRTSAATRSA
ncbi:AAA family ATPase [Streptomyces syringium]|uniref:ATP-binding protein n=1 Tax=Streptomyces syringium TaxID=76729 RepID=UPI003D8E3AFA